MFFELVCMRGNLEIDLLMTHGSNAATALLVTVGLESSMPVFYLSSNDSNDSTAAR